MADPERIDETIQRNFATLLDRVEQVMHGGFAVTFHVLEPDLRVALGKREDVGRLLYPFLLEEEFDLLLAESLYVESTSRAEQFKVLDLLVRTGKFACAACARALLAGRGFLADYLCFERTWAPGREMVFFFSPRLVRNDIDDLGNNIAGTLDHDRVADADVAAVAQLFTAAAYAPYVVLVVQRDILHDDAANADRLQFANGREGAGAANLDLDTLEHGDCALGRKFMRDAPARRARNETEPLLPVDAIDLVDDAVDIVVEFGPPFLDLPMEREELLG